MAKIKESKISKEDEAEILAFKAKIETSLFHFSNFFMRDNPEAQFTVPTPMNKVSGMIPQFQVNLFQLLDDLNTFKRLVLASPRGFTKSTTCSIFFPLQVALLGKFKEILIVSNSEALSIQLMRQIRTNIESNDLIKAIFGDMTSEKWTETHLILRNKVSIRGCGWGMQARGFRPDLIIFDDIESDETVASEDLTRKLEDYILGTAVPSLVPHGSCLFVGTLLSRLSIIYNFIHNPPSGWKSVFNQAYYNGIEAPGHELWPEIWTHEKLQQRKSEIGSARFSREYMNNPLPRDGNRLNPKFLKYFTEQDLEGKNLGEYVSIDPSFSDSSSADYGVITNLLHDANDNIYIDHVFREKATSSTLIKYFINMYKQRKNRIRAVGVEANGPQKAFYDRLVEECNLQGLYPPFQKLTGSINGVKNKVDRCTFTIQPRLEAGKIYFRANDANQRPLIDELTLFPESKNDDFIDTLAYGISMLQTFSTYEHDQFSFENEIEQIMPNRGVTGYGEDDIYVMGEKYGT